MFLCIIKNTQNKTREVFYNQKCLSIAFLKSSRKPSEKLTNSRTSQDIYLDSAANLEGNAINVTNTHKVTSLLQQLQPFLHIKITSLIYF